MSFENALKLDSQVVSIMKGFGSGSAEEVLQNEPSFTSSFTKFESLIQNHLSFFSFSNEFVRFFPFFFNFRPF